MKPIPKTRFRFRRVGGAWQPRIDNPGDLANLLRLDDAFWAMTGVSAEILRFDGRLLKFLDFNGEGRIHCDEVKKAFCFLRDSLLNLDGVMRGADSLRFSNLNAEDPAVAAMLDAARLLLGCMGKNAADEISLADFQSEPGRAFLARASRKAGMIPVEDFPPECQPAIRLIRESGRILPEEGGRETLSPETLDDFLLCVEHRLAHQERLSREPALLFDGDDTERSYALYAEIAPEIDACFLNAAARKFFASDPERTAKKECLADLWEPADVRQALERSAAAGADPEGKIDFSAPLNPLSREKLQAFAALPFMRKFLEKSLLSEENWRAVKALTLPYENWKRNTPGNDGLETIPLETLRAFVAEEKAGSLRRFLEKNRRYDIAAADAERLFILLLLQRDFLRFLRNFVTLEDLFDPTEASRLQAGVLVMDGRHFTLAIPVKNIDEHKKIVRKSNICVLYVEISTLHDGADVKRLLAVGVTDGTMKNLFIGKRGVFFDTEQECWSARIVDMLEQPVSIGEALKAPFCRFGEIFVRQTEKIFNTRGEDAQKTVTASLASVLPPAAAAPSAKPAAGLPMLLMGGGIGLAAIGSSVAFIAKSLRSVSLLSLLMVVLGIFLIFGGPIVFLAIIKLFRRNLAVFLEASGCSLNQPMRLSFRMGTIFTFAPRRPLANLLWKDPSDTFAAFRRKEGFSRKGRIRLGILLLILGILCSVFAARKWLIPPPTKSLSPALSAPVSPEAGQAEQAGNDRSKKTSSSPTIGDK